MMVKIVKFPSRAGEFPPSTDFAVSQRLSYNYDKMTTQVEIVQKNEAQFRVAEWLVEPSLNRISRDGVSVQLELKAMDVLLCLAGRPGELVTKHELVDTVWQTEFVSDNTLTRRIAELRGAFGDDARNPRYIETITKRGYRLIAEVTLFDAPTDILDAGLVGNPSDEASPYPGLAPFTESDTENFFGREREITALWRRITGHRLLAVIGPSGAGKSSLLRAGVVARAPPGWRAVVCQPGEEPFLALARALAPDLAGNADEMRQLLAFHDPDIALAVAARWRGRWDEALLVVDQFEELFTLNPSPVQERFVELLRRLANAAGIHVVLVLRDDFLLECHRHPLLAPIFDHLTPVGPPPPAELRRALTEPAARHLFAFENEVLVDEMVGEVETERGALPLLAFAVSRLWELRDRERRLLARAAYEEIGGVGGALAQHAEETLEAIGAERMPVVRELFRNLVTAQSTRAVRDVDELLSVFGESARDEALSVLNALVDARLLTVFEEDASVTHGEGRRRIEIAHESLLRAWPRLVRWQTQDADAAQLRDQLRQAAHMWRTKGRPRDLLWFGTSYREFAVWRERYPGGLSAVENEFVEAMTRHALRRRRRRRIVVAALILGLLAVAVVVTTLWRRSEHHARRVEARRFFEIGRQAIDSSPCDALAWSIASLELEDNLETRRLAVQALRRSPMPLAVDRGVNGKFTISASFSPDGRWLASGNSGGEIVLWPSRGGEPRSWQAHATLTWGSFLSDPGVFLSTAFGDPRRVFWSVPEGERLGEVETITAIVTTHANTSDVLGLDRMVRAVKDPSVAGGWDIDHRPAMLREQLQEGYPPRAGLGPNGRDLVFALGAELFLADVERPEATPRAIGRSEANIKQIVFAPNGQHFATIDDESVVRVWARPTGTWEEIRSWRGWADVDSHHLNFDRSGRYVVVSYDMGGVVVHGLGDPPGADPFRIRPGGSRVVRSEVDPSNRWLATAAMRRLAVWPFQRSQYPFILRGHSSLVEKIDFGPDGDFLVSTGADGTVRHWPLEAGPGVAPRTIHDWGHPIEIQVGWQDLSDDGTVVVATGNENHFRVIPLDGRRSFDLAEADQRISRAAVSTDGRLVAAMGRFDGRNEIRIWDLENGGARSIELQDDPGWPPLGFILEFTRDGRLVSSFASRVREYDPVTLQKKYLVEGMMTIALDGDGRTLIGREGIGGGGEAVAVVHGLSDGSSTRLSSHGSEVVALALDRTGTIAITGDRNGNLRVGPVSGESPHLLTLDDRYVSAVAVSPGRKWVASGHDDGTIRLWPMPDLSKPPLHTLPRPELLAKLKSLTNLRVVPDPEDPGEYVVRAGPFPGWETVPEW